MAYWHVILEEDPTVPTNLPEPIDAPFRWTQEPPNPLDRPEYYDGLLWRRSVAFCVDAGLLIGVVIAFWIFNILTFFIFTALIFLVWAAPLFVVYDTATIGSRAAATFGMRWLNLEVRTWDGGMPGYLHAFISSALFWLLTPLTGGLILLVGVFSDRRRQVHDYLSGTVVINTKADRMPAISGP